MLIVRSESRDVYRNLAVEEWLLDHAPHLPVLLLYVNDPCVVIGKNQNPWRECRLSLMENEGVKLARRVSGGGAVYHDAGNLNLSIIVPRGEYREEKQYELVFQTLEAFGVKSSKLGKSSLAVDGKKFSGQAFCHRRDRTLHHGTLLVDTDLTRLGRYLGPELDDIETRAIASVPSEVMNLSAAAPGLTVERLSAALVETFQTMYGGESSEFRVPSSELDVSGSEFRVSSFGESHFEVSEEELFPGIGKYSSKGWNLEHTPRFDAVVNGVRCTVEKGRVTNLTGNPLFEEWLADQRV